MMEQENNHTEGRLPYCSVYIISLPHLPKNTAVLFKKGKIILHYTINLPQALIMQCCIVSVEEQGYCTPVSH